MLHDTEHLVIYEGKKPCSATVIYRTTSRLLISTSSGNVEMTTSLAPGTSDVFCCSFLCIRVCMTESSV